MYIHLYMYIWKEIPYLLRVSAKDISPPHRSKTQTSRPYKPAVAPHGPKWALLGCLRSPSLGSNGFYDPNNYSKPALYHPKAL